jgi:hypothetical protein
MHDGGRHSKQAYIPGVNLIVRGCTSKKASRRCTTVAVATVINTFDDVGSDINLVVWLTPWSCGERTLATEDKPIRTARRTADTVTIGVGPRPTHPVPKGLVDPTRSPTPCTGVVGRCTLAIVMRKSWLVIMFDPVHNGTCLQADTRPGHNILGHR